VRVVVADDHVLLRAGIVELLTAAGLAVVGQAGTADETLALVDHTLPRCRRARHPHAANAHPGGPPCRPVDSFPTRMAIGILLLSQYVETRHAVDLLAGGAVLAYLHAGTDSTQPER
jgi:hypothetical protein